MKLRELLAKVRRKGCTTTEGKRHTKVTCGACKTTVPRHAADIGTGLLRAIEKALEPCLRAGWLEDDE